MKKIGLLVFVLVLLSTAVFVGSVRPVEASGPMNISSDYTFTSNIYEPIVVTAENIIIDGAGYKVQGTGSGTGIYLSDRNNVTLKNVEVTNFTYGIYLSHSTNNTITGNTVTSNNHHGIYLSFSIHNTITGNNASSNGIYGIYLDYSSNKNTVSGNTASSNNDFGIYLSSSSNNTVTGNTASSNGLHGIDLFSSNNNAITGNTASNNTSGIYLSDSSNNTVSGNTVSNNEYGIYFYESSNNAIFHNNFMNNTQQVYDYSWDYPVTPSINIWDDGIEGNLWSDYEDRYPDAEEIDGIWDTPYVIDGNNQDYYPIVPEFPTWTSMLLILIVLSVAVAIYKRRLLKTPIH